MAMKNTETNYRRSEKGSAGTKLLVTLLVLFLFAHAGYNYIPTAYDGASLKQEMQTAVVQGLAAPANVAPTELVKGRIQRAIAANNIPADAVVQVKALNKNLQAQVSYTKKVNILPFGLYTYEYRFDHTATPTGFLATM